jgi:hypothetical protein
MAQQTSFLVDEGTASAIEELKKVFNVTTNAAVIRKAVALARVAARESDDDDTITLLDRNQQPLRVLLGR